jgi:hypothetical protein
MGLYVIIICIVLYLLDVIYCATSASIITPQILPYFNRLHIRWKTKGLLVTSLLSFAYKRRSKWSPCSWARNSALVEEKTQQTWEESGWIPCSTYKLVNLTPQFLSSIDCTCQTLVCKYWHTHTNMRVFKSGQASQGTGDSHLWPIHQRG